MSEFACDVTTTDSCSIQNDIMPVIHVAMAEDHAFIKEFLPKAAILTLTKEFVTVVIMRTQYSRVQLRFQYSGSYPEEVPLIELSSPTLPAPLLRQKEKECADIAKELIGKSQVAAVYKHIHSFIHKNMFVSCWKEVKQIIQLCQGKGQLGADEKEGLLHMRLQQGNYNQGIKLRVPFLYPEEGVQIEFTTSNFPPDIQYMFRCQAEEISRRCVAGFSPDMAIQGSNPIELASTKKATDTGAIKLTSGNLKALKHDVGVLKQLSDLRVASTAKGKKYQYSTEVSAERREARRELRKLAQAESEADLEQERQIRDQEQEEMKIMMRSKVSDVAQLSLFAVARFLIEDYVMRLPVEPCQACRQPVLAADPTAESCTNPRSSKRPMRTFCGHWLHHHCLDDWLCSPPFIRQCPVCDRRIWHPDWPEDFKVLEKAWNHKEARKREELDVSDFMGMGDQFSK